MIDINTKVQFRSIDGQERKGIIDGYENNLYKINCVFIKNNSINYALIPRRGVAICEAPTGNCPAPCWRWP